MKRVALVVAALAVFAIVTSTILYAVLLLLGSNLAPEMTQLVAENGLALPSESGSISSIANPFTWVMVMLTRLF